jgi:hypothetical protein
MLVAQREDSSRSVTKPVVGLEGIAVHCVSKDALET